jgi:hypothetical protein
MFATSAEPARPVCLCHWMAVSVVKAACSRTVGLPLIPKMAADFPTGEPCPAGRPDRLDVMAELASHPMEASRLACRDEPAALSADLLMADELVSSAPGVSHPADRLDCSARAELSGGCYLVVECRLTEESHSAADSAWILPEEAFPRLADFPACRA